MTMRDQSWWDSGFHLVVLRVNVRFIQANVINKDLSIPDLNRFLRQADNPLYVRLLWFLWVSELDDISTFNLTHIH